MTTRRRFLLSTTAAVSAAASYPLFIERFRVELSHYHVPLPGLARPLKLVQLSDFHHSTYVPLAQIDFYLDLAIDQRPDLFCLTGDFVDGPHRRTDPAYSSVLKRLARTAPTFATLGNHDGGLWLGERTGIFDHDTVERLLSRAEIELLHNRHTRFRDGLLTLAGVGDLWSREVDAPAAFESIPTASPTILLNHNPDAKELALPFPWHLMLSGHTHGGQFRPPFMNHLDWTPVVDTRFIDGLHRWQGRYLHVNRGLGGICGVRFNCRPEISVLHLEPGFDHRDRRHPLA